MTARMSAENVTLHFGNHFSIQLFRVIWFALTTELNCYERFGDYRKKLNIWYPNKNKHSFAILDIDNFYPSIAESLLLKEVDYAKRFTTIKRRHQYYHALPKIPSLYPEHRRGKEIKQHAPRRNGQLGWCQNMRICFAVYSWCLKRESENVIIVLYGDDDLQLF